MTSCSTCKCRLALAYVRYKDTAGNPYCHVCYTRLLNGWTTVGNDSFYIIGFLFRSSDNMTDEDAGLTDMSEAQWYMVFAFFIMIWMVMMMVILWFVAIVI